MTSISTLYDQMITDGTLRPDAAQKAIMPEFDRIREALSQPIKKGLFRKAPEPPKGLYL